MKVFTARKQFLFIRHLFRIKADRPINFVHCCNVHQTAQLEIITKTVKILSKIFYEAKQWSLMFFRKVIMITMHSTWQKTSKNMCVGNGLHRFMETILKFRYLFKVSERSPFHKNWRVPRWAPSFHHWY